MTITHKPGSTKGSFIAAIDGQEAGVMTYSNAGPDKFIIDHTEVHPGHEGQGVGKQLVKAAVEYARQHQMKIMPLCPFAKSVFDRNAAELADVRA